MEFLRRTGRGRCRNGHDLISGQVFSCNRLLATGLPDSGLPVDNHFSKFNTKRGMFCFPAPGKLISFEVLAAHRLAIPWIFFCAFAKRQKRALAAMQNSVLTNVPIFQNPGQDRIPCPKNALAENFNRSGTVTGGVLGFAQMQKTSCAGLVGNSLLSASNLCN